MFLILMMKTSDHSKLGLSQANFLDSSDLNWIIGNIIASTKKSLNIERK